MLKIAHHIDWLYKLISIANLKLTGERKPKN